MAWTSILAPYAGNNDDLSETFFDLRIDWLEEFSRRCCQPMTSKEPGRLRSEARRWSRVSLCRAE
jgi:hypothetical protein